MSQRNNLIQYLPVPYKKKRFYTLQDLKLHNTANDCWITFFNQIYDITALIQQNINSPFIKPLIEAAGSDITYWFDPLSKDPRVQIDLNTGLEKFYCPQGIFLHIQPSGPENINLVEDLQTPWWKNPIFFIGRLTIRSSKINIINMLTQHEDLIEVPCEETINTFQKDINKQMYMQQFILGKDMEDLLIWNQTQKKIILLIKLQNLKDLVIQKMNCIGLLFTYILMWIQLF
ncbi:hypothetical protein IMG5_018720, partial [Ichthyophthirius multifiliis]